MPVFGKFTAEHRPATRFGQEAPHIRSYWRQRFCGLNPVAWEHPAQDGSIILEKRSRRPRRSSASLLVIRPRAAWIWLN